MFAYNNPSATVLQEDAGGRLHITEPRLYLIANRAGGFFMFAVLAVCCLYIMYVGLHLLPAAPPSPAQCRLFSLATLAAYFALPLSFSLAFMLRHPWYLDIDGNGIAFVSFGKLHKIAWHEIRDIALCTMPDIDTSPYRVIYITDMRFKRTMLPRCAVSPVALAEYIVARRNLAGLRPEISLSDLGISETMRQAQVRSGNLYRFYGFIALLLAYVAGYAWLFKLAFEIWGI